MEQQLHTYSNPWEQADRVQADIETGQAVREISCLSQGEESPSSEVTTGFSDSESAEATISPAKGALALQVGILTAAALGIYAANGGRAHRARHLKMQNGGLNKKQPMPKEQRVLRRRKRR